MQKAFEEPGTLKQQVLTPFSKLECSVVQLKLTHTEENQWRTASCATNNRLEPTTVNPSIRTTSKQARSSKFFLKTDSVLIAILRATQAFFWMICRSSQRRRLHACFHRSRCKCIHSASLSPAREPSNCQYQCHFVVICNLNVQYRLHCLDKVNCLYRTRTLTDMRFYSNKLHYVI